MTTAYRLVTQHRSRKRVSRFPIRRLLLVGFLVVLALLVLAGLFAAIRYLPALDTAHDVRASLNRAMSAMNNPIHMETSDLDAAAADIADARRGIGTLNGVLADDGLVTFSRNLPLIGPQVKSADDLVAAASDVADGGDALLDAGRKFIVARDGSGDPAPRLVGLMQDVEPDVTVAVAKLQAANDLVAKVPDGSVGPIIDARNELRDRLAQILPPLTAYSAADDYLPSLLGADGEKRYLVMAEDPAELRPTGGFMGTYGIVSTTNGVVTSDFEDVYSLDLLPTDPYVEPPADLKDRLLGQYPWQLADANWSPDYPTSAQKTLELYSLESGDTKIDGVIVLNTYAIDKLLELTGPIDVAGYGVRIKAGETLFTALANTRHGQAPGVGRKEFLSVLASGLMDALRNLPVDRWQRALSTLEEIRAERQAMVWLADPSLEAHVVAAGWDGGIRQDNGDYLMAVDSNVAPTGKLNSVVTRTLDMAVTIDKFGNAHDSLNATWHNPILEGVGPDFDTLRTIQDGRQILGNFMRLVVPDRSRFESVSGGSISPVSSLESTGSEAGRTWFGAYLMIPPGDTTLDWSWTAPYVVETSGHEAVYRLTLQKEPGTAGDPISLAITVPDGASITAVPDGATVDGQTVHWTGQLQTDVQLELRYTVP